MGTPYSEIYKRAITEFKDPTLKQLFSTSQILFFEVMHNYLENAIQLFTNPVETQKKLKNVKHPYLVELEVECDGKDTFELQRFPNDNELDDVVFECTIDNENVEFEYIPEKHQIKLNILPEDGKILNINWYFSGVFENTLNDEEQYILQQFIMACWSEYILNDKLDIIRLLGDNDFKLPANGTTTTSKVGWNIVNRETVTKRMNHYAWMQAFNRWGVEK